MKSIEMTASELYFLAEYIDMDDIFGVLLEQEDSNTMLSLVEKRILGKKGNLTDFTIMHIKLIEKYNQSYRYFAFQNYIFGVQEDGLCIVLEHNERTDTYQIKIGDLFQLLVVATKHPRIREDVVTLLQQQFPERKTEGNMPRERKSTLIMELFDNKGNSLQKKYVGYKNRKYYALDKEMYWKEEIEKENYIEWIISCFPNQIEQVVEKVVREVQN
ncbi:MAG: DUF5081 family protein [Coprobacillaceae bacterium]